MMLNNLTKIYHDHLLIKRGREAREYLAGRGITTDTLKHFKIGFCSDNVGYEYIHRVFGEGQIKASKLFPYKRDFFNGRIIFPLIKKTETIYLTSRTLNGSGSKHLHMHGAIPIPFNYNIIDKADKLFIVESPIDCLTLHQLNYSCVAALGIYGLPNTVIKEMPQKVYIAYDNATNGSGNKGAVRIAEMLFKQNIIANIITFPVGHDANSNYVKKITPFDKLIEQSVPCTTLKDFDPEPKKWVKERGSFVPLVKKYKLKISGKYVILKCPFHHDTKPSLRINLERNSCYCYGCNKRPTVKELDEKLGG